jgi:hypothetical protein
MPRMPTITSVVIIEFLKSVGSGNRGRKAVTSSSGIPTVERLLSHFIRVKIWDAASQTRCLRTLS